VIAIVGPAGADADLERVIAFERGDPDADRARHERASHAMPERQASPERREIVGVGRSQDHREVRAARALRFDAESERRQRPEVELREIVSGNSPPTEPYSEPDATGDEGRDVSRRLLHWCRRIGVQATKPIARRVPRALTSVFANAR